MAVQGPCPSKPEHRLGTGKALEAGFGRRVDGPARKPPNKSAGESLPRTRYGVGHYNHPRESLRMPALHEQARVSDLLFREAAGIKYLPQPVIW